MKPGGRRLALGVGGWLALNLLASVAGTESRLAEAERSLAAGDAATAERLYRSYLTAEPESLEGRIGLARALVARGRVREATAGLLVSARRAIAADDYRAGEILLTTAVGLDPDSREALAELGRVLALERKYRSAEGPLRRAVELGRQDLRTLLYFGSTLWENGKLEEAETVLRRAVTTGNRTVLAVHQLARLLLWQGRFDEAAELMAEAADRSPSAADIQLGLAQALAGAGRDAAAVVAYRRVCELQPQNPQARYGLAMALVRSGEREAAEAELALYRSLYEADQERLRREGRERAQIDHGYALLRAGDTDRAVRHLRSLPAGPDVLAALAAAHAAAGDLERSVELLERAVSLAPEREDLRALLLERRLAALALPR